MIYEIPPYIFHNPASIVISGITQSGKTSFICRLLNNLRMFKTVPERIIYCYGVWQDKFDKLSGVEFREGLDFPADLGGKPSLLIVDDLMREAMDSKGTLDLVTRASHHKNITVIFLIQNIFHRGSSARDITLNAHYKIIMNNDQDLEQIRLMGRRCGLRDLFELAYLDCMKTPYNYLLVDSSPHNKNKELKLKTNIFPGENQIIYLPQHAI